jgi:hypothetical protein
MLKRNPPPTPPWRGVSKMKNPIILNFLLSRLIIVNFNPFRCPGIFFKYI